MTQRAIPLLLLLAALSATAVAAAVEFRGLGLEQAIEKLEARGLSILYSSDLVTPGLVVETEPSATDPREILKQIVEPLGLAVAPAPGGAVMLVRRSGPGATDAARDSTAAVPPQPAVPPAMEIDEIVVSASRYRLTLGQTAAATGLTARDIGLLPAIGEDPMRTVERLPGMASQDYTAKPNVRGGVDDETLVQFDGVRLYNPYHLKDFQNLFSTLDPGVVSGLTVYTAGFPIVFGDRMSGVIDVQPFVPADGLQGRVAASLFNAGGRVNGSFDDGRGHWVAAARRGNLDVFLDIAGSNLGNPTYSDFYVRLDHEVGESAVLSGNVLVFNDDLQVTDSDQEEEADATYRDEYFWVGLDFGELGARDPGVPGAPGEETVAAAPHASGGGQVRAMRVQLASDRVGTADLPGVTRGSLDDHRSFTIDALMADGWWPLGTRSVLQAGAEWSRSTGRYDFQDQAEFAALFLYPGAPQQPILERNLLVKPTGQQYAAYLNWKLAPAPAVTLDAGLRWEAETIGGVSSNQLSPRIGLLWAPDPDTRLRASWGEFSQPQRINELPVSDGETKFYPAQRAEHWVASLERRLGRDWSVRLEAYRKNYRDPRPRYENLLDPLIVLPEIRPDRVRIEPESATADGAELSLHYGDGAPLAAWLAYGWSSVTDDIAGKSVPRSWDLSNSVSAGVSYRGAQWEMSMTATLHSGWPTTAVELATLDPFPLVATGPRNAERLDDYFRLDARIARRYVFESGQSLTVFLEASNLTNRRNACCVEYQMESDTGGPYLDVGVVDSIPIVPSIGFVWEF